MKKSVKIVSKKMCRMTDAQLDVFVEAMYKVGVAGEAADEDDDTMSIPSWLQSVKSPKRRKR